MTHLDLFSGIGGFAYAADQVWPGIEHVFCDNEPFAQAVLKKHWPESYIYDDIRSITNASLKRLQREVGEECPGRTQRPRRIDLITGGFPCQPFSAAGLRRGTADDRHLWPEMLRVIRLAKPEWVIAENVRGITTWNDGVVFEQVCADLEASGYEVQPFIIPAVAVNAPHRRDRVWFIAHSSDYGNRTVAGDAGSETEEERLQERNEVRKSEQSDTVWDAADTGRLRGEPGRGKALRPESQESERTDSLELGQGYSWQSNWLEVATELCRLDDGLPARVDGLELTSAQHRKEQLKAYGNAIVPQVAVELMRAMLIQ